MSKPRSQEYESATALRIGLRQFLARSERIIREHDLTPERYELLLLIKTAPDGEATVGKLGARLAIGQSAATQLARRAEDAGLIERTMSPRDARVHPLRLTEEGARRLDRALVALREERTQLAAQLQPLLADAKRPPRRR
jgi:DNA-binding MarR family transcriptional regulator